MSALQHANTIIAAINASGGNAMLPEDAKATAALKYTEVWVSATVDRNERVGSLGGITPIRVVTRAMCQHQLGAENERAAAETALLGKTITVAGESFGPLRREMGDDPIGDGGDGWWVGATTWIYA